MLFGGFFGNSFGGRLFGGRLFGGRLFGGRLFGRLIRPGHWARAEVGREQLVGIVHLSYVLQLFGSADIFRFACLGGSSRFLGLGRLQRPALSLLRG